MGELLEISWGMLASRIVTEQRTIVDVIDEWVSNAAAILDAIDDDFELRLPLVDALNDMGKAIDLACENSVQVAELVNETAGFRAGLNYQKAHLFLGAFPESLNVAFLGCPTITLPGSTVLSFVISTLEQYARDVQSRIEFRDESASHSAVDKEIVETGDGSGRVSQGNSAEHEGPTTSPSSLSDLTGNESHGDSEDELVTVEYVAKKLSQCGVEISSKRLLNKYKKDWGERDNKRGNAHLFIWKRIRPIVEKQFSVKFNE